MIPEEVEVGTLVKATPPAVLLVGVELLQLEVEDQFKPKRTLDKRGDRGVSDERVRMLG